MSAVKSESLKQAAWFKLIVEFKMYKTVANLLTDDLVNWLATSRRAD